MLKTLQNGKETGPKTTLNSLSDAKNTVRDSIKDETFLAAIDLRLTQQLFEKNANLDEKKQKWPGITFKAFK